MSGGPRFSRSRPSGVYSSGSTRFAELSDGEDRLQGEPRVDAEPAAGVVERNPAAVAERAPVSGGPDLAGRTAAVADDVVDCLAKDRDQQAEGADVGPVAGGGYPTASRAASGVSLIRFRRLGRRYGIGSDLTAVPTAPSPDGPVRRRARPRAREPRRRVGPDLPRLVEELLPDRRRVAVIPASSAARRPPSPSRLRAIIVIVSSSALATASRSTNFPSATSAGLRASGDAEESGVLLADRRLDSNGYGPSART